MKWRLKDVFARVLLSSGIDTLYRRFAPPRFIILGYHSISDPANHEALEGGFYKHLSVPSGLFEREMRFLLAEGYTFLRFSDLLDVKTGARAIPAKPVMVYFDDGYKDNYLNAYPILKRLGIPATVFLVVNFVDRAAVPWGITRDPKNMNMFLAWDDARAMGDIFEFGTHTMSHRKLTSLSELEMRHEMIRSRDSIAEHTGKPVIALSYPKSRFDDAVRRVAQEVGFDFILSHSRGFNYTVSQLLNKIPVGPDDSFMLFRLKLGVYYPLITMLRAMKQVLFG